MQSPLVSLVIPTFNRSDRLEEAVASALKQTYGNLEVLIVDDASTDDTACLIESLSENEQLRYIRQPSNQGPNANWRTGMEAARGEFFGFLADDDVLEPSYVERLVAPLLDDEQAILAFSDHWVIDADGRRQPEITAQNAANYGRDQLEGGKIDNLARVALIDESIYIGAVLFRRADVPPSFLAPEARSAMGGWILYRCVKTGKHGYYVPERLMNCRWQEGSVSRSQRWLDAMTAGNINRQRMMLADPALQRFRPQFEQQLAVNLAIRGRMQLIKGKRREARALLSESFGLRPRTKTAAAFLLAHLGGIGTRVARGLRWLSGNG